jgi:hypothetical protein
MLTQRAEQGTAQAQAQQHKQPREVIDAHLEGLQWDTGGISTCSCDAGLWRVPGWTPWEPRAVEPG